MTIDFELLMKAGEGRVSELVEIGARTRILEPLMKTASFDDPWLNIQLKTPVLKKIAPSASKIELASVATLRNVLLCFVA